MKETATRKLGGSVCDGRGAVRAAGIHDQIGKGSDMLVPSLLPDWDEAAAKELGEAHSEIFTRRFLADIRPLPGPEHRAGS